MTTLVCNICEHVAAGVDAIAVQSALVAHRQAAHPKLARGTVDYGTDVERFNADHNGCRMGRYPHSDYTNCDTHGAYVRHGVPTILRDI